MEESTSYKVLQGSYKYIKNNTIYSEESFEVFKEKKENSYYFESELHSRVATGELLTLKVTYKVNKDYIPYLVILERSLGENSIKEVYDFDIRKNVLTYNFFDKAGEQHTETLPTANKFHITTPCTSCSMIFLRSKKFDNSGNNTYTFWSSRNHWEFESAPTSQVITVKKISTGYEQLVLDTNKLQALEYRLWKENENLIADKNSEAVEPKYIRIFLSKHLTIPYLVRDDEDNLKIQIIHLKDLE